MTAPNNAPLAVTAVGMVTCLGRDCSAACAAARAGITRTTALENLDFGGDEVFGRETLDGVPPLTGNVVREVADGFSGPARTLLLGGAALDDLLPQRPLSDHERSRTGLVLNLSDHFVHDTDARARERAPLPSADWRSRTTQLLPRLAAMRALAVPPSSMRIIYGGHAGIAAAVREAASMMGDDSVDRCIVGGIDCRTDAAFLQCAARLQLLRTGDNPVGLIPGEGAAFFLLERSREAARAKVSSLAHITTSVVAKESFDLLSNHQVPTGIELAQVIREALGSSPSIAIAFSIGDLNGTSRRALEWGGALVRLRAEHKLADLPVWFPALSFGDTGAAAGAIGLGMAVRAFARGYAPGQGALLWLSSENGSKGAMVVRAPGN